ncbi:hypothetical protein RB195_016162 [Necator americanus]
MHLLDLAALQFAWISFAIFSQCGRVRRRFEREKFKKELMPKSNSKSRSSRALRSKGGENKMESRKTILSTKQRPIQHFSNSPNDDINAFKIEKARKEQSDDIKTDLHSISSNKDPLTRKEVQEALIKKLRSPKNLKAGMNYEKLKELRKNSRGREPRLNSQKVKGEKDARQVRSDDVFEQPGIVKSDFAVDQDETPKEANSSRATPAKEKEECRSKFSHQSDPVDEQPQSHYEIEKNGKWRTRLSRMVTRRRKGKSANTANKESGQQPQAKKPQAKNVRSRKRSNSLFIASDFKDEKSNYQLEERIQG